MKAAVRILSFSFLLVAAGAPGAMAEEEAHGEAAGESAHGEEGHGEHHGIDGKTLAFQLLNFGVLVFILVKFGGGAINKALRARHDQLKVDLQEAATARAAAETRLKQQEARLANLEQELAALRASLRQEAEHEKGRLLATTEERVRRLQQETTFLLDQQVKEAERRFREELTTTALKVAEDKVRKALQFDDEQRLVQTFVNDLEGGAPGPRHTTFPSGGSGESERKAPAVTGRAV